MRVLTASSRVRAWVGVVGLLFVSELEARPPNVLLILADDVGREVLGCYGGESYETPRLDRLAKEGMRFEHAYVQPMCHPTRIALLTGKYPSRFPKARWGSFPSDAEESTLAQVMKRAGYRTAVAGKWQLTLLGKDLEQPRRMGFDEYCLFGWHEGPRYYRPWIWQNGKRRADVEKRYGPDVYTDFLIDVMARPSERPFFAFYSMALAHDVTDDLKEPVAYAPGKERYDSYGEMVAAMDRMVGKLLDALDRLELGERTLVVFLSDNGTPGQMITRAKGKRFVREPVSSRWLGRTVRGGKTRLSDLGIRVPWIVRWPGRVRAGAVSEALVDATDVLPTLAELAVAAGPQGSGGPKGSDDSRGSEATTRGWDEALKGRIDALKGRIDGRSWFSVVRENTKGAREWIYAEGGRQACVRDRRWKLYSDGRLYDVENDAFEETEVTTETPSAAAKAARARLGAVLRDLRGK